MVLTSFFYSRFAQLSFCSVLLPLSGGGSLFSISIRSSWLLPPGATALPCIACHTGKRVRSFYAVAATLLGDTSAASCGGKHQRAASSDMSTRKRLGGINGKMIGWPAASGKVPGRGPSEAPERTVITARFCQQGCRGKRTPGMNNRLSLIFLGELPFSQLISGFSTFYLFMATASATSSFASSLVRRRPNAECLLTAGENVKVGWWWGWFRCVSRTHVATQRNVGVSDGSTNACFLNCWLLESVG